MELLSKFIPNTLALNVMKSWVKLKVREEDGKNRGSIVDAIHELADGDDEDAAAWCMRAIMAACVTAGWASGTKLDPRISTSGSVHKQWLRTFKAFPEICVWAKDVTDPVAQIRPGMVMIRYELVDVAKGHVEGNAKLGHTEMVSAVYSDGSFDTIGGNTGSGSNADAREGDGVYEKSKHYSLKDKRVVGFWMPRFVPIA